MTDPDEIERDLRLELMRLDRRLKVRDLRIKDQQLAYEPIKMMFLAGGFAAALAAVFNFIF
ncbi:MAG: hypothetical protein EPO02_05135 [Nitrospirae bacterium]|nr:MAG: hypothetical protein EPO02_05135 [Nitrospirota bacterium]